MYKALVILIGLALSSPSQAQQQKLTGHIWKERPQILKVMYVRAFLDGYSVGRMEGSATGAMNAIKWAESRACKLSDAACESVTVKKGSLDAIGLLVSVPPAFEQAVTHYVSEVDSFYEAYPLCRGETLLTLMQQFVWIWDDPKTATTYQKIGSECGGRKP